MVKKIIKDDKQYGEMKCPYCNAIFFSKKSLSGHIGGAHRKDITKSGIPVCKFCKEELTEYNWPKWARKSHNLICNICKKQQNRESYRRKVKKMSENPELAEKEKQKKIDKQVKQQNPKKYKFIKNVITK